VDEWRNEQGVLYLIELPPLPRPPMSLGEEIIEPWQIWEPE
jgi:hypothetical protein